jgi:putative inorganic carbon (HCO3(-)) transporter
MVASEISPTLRRYFRRMDVWMFIAAGSVGSYILLVPSLSPLPSLRPYVEKRVLEIGLLIITGGLLLASSSARQQWLSVFRSLPRRGCWGLGAVLGLGLVSSAFAPAPFYAFLEVGHFVLLFATAGIVAAAVRRASGRVGPLLLGVVAASAALYAAYFAVGYGMHFAMADIELWPDESTNFTNVRIFNQYQTWTLPLLAGAVLVIPRRWRIARGGVFGVLALWWALVFASNVRGTVVALAVAAIGVGLVFRSKAKRWLAVQAAAVLSGVALYYLLFPSGTAPPVTDEFADAGEYSWRLQRWRTCLEMAWAHPWLGAGPMHFAWPPFHYAPGASPHSALMQWLAEWGIPSTLMMSGMTIWGGWRWIQQERDRVFGRDRSDPVAVALVASILAGAAHSMVSGLIVAPLSQVVLAVLGGWAWRRYQHERDPTPSTSVSAHAVLCVALVASMAIVSVSLRDLSTIKERRMAFVKSVERNVYSPRWWLQGYIGVRDSSVIERARRDR